MRRALLIAAVLIVFLPLASGQMRGFHGGRASAGFSRFGTGRPFFRTGGGFFFNSPPFGVRWGFGPPFFPSRFVRRRVFYPAPLAYSVYPSYAYSYPGTYDYSAYSSTNSYYPDIYYEQNRVRAEQDRSVSRELDRLSDEVAQLRAERESAKAAPERPAQQQRSTMLVFRDRHLEEVQNYAVVGQTLWTFSEQRARKVPLNDLDVAATTKLNDERGVEFALPATR